MPRPRTLEEVFDMMFDDDAIISQTGGTYDPYDCEDWDDEDYGYEFDECDFDDFLPLS